MKLCCTNCWTQSITLHNLDLADERLNDIVGSAYYVAPEVLHRSYSMEADVWSIGVITYILLCGSRPFWARTESGIFRAVLRADPSFEDAPWPSVSAEAKDFVKRLLNKDLRRRMTAAQALSMFCPLQQMVMHLQVFKPFDLHASLDVDMRSYFVLCLKVFCDSQHIHGSEAAIRRYLWI